MKKLFFMLCLITGMSLTIQSTYAQKEKKGINGLLGVKVTTTQDKFEGTTTHRMEGNKVKIKGATGSSIGKGALGLVLGGGVKMSIMTTRLQLENHIVNDSISQLAVILKVSVKDDAAFYPMAGESLIFLVDGKRIGLSTEGEYNAERFQGINNNSKVFARYPITQEQLETIINAKQVQFRMLQEHFMDGQAKTRDKKDSSFEGEFSKKNFKAWQDFYQNYVLNTPKE
ncbi:hypothetical protein [Flavisericum labens]|uniref:hypothetical protein n=1 Tax=Flavisericum labens TaxID=3377112 RepID=UPI00387B71F9